MGKASSRPRKGGGKRGRMRSARALFDYAGALAYRALEEPRRRGDLVESFVIFISIAESTNTHHFGRYRALALYNATALLQVMPAKSAIGLAGRLARAALLAVADESFQEVAQQFVRLHESLIQRATAHATPDTLRWAKRGESRLISDSRRGKDKIATVPMPGFRGTWDGVSILLDEYGLRAPRPIGFSGSVLLQPKGTSLVATPV